MGTTEDMTWQPISKLWTVLFTNCGGRVVLHDLCTQHNPPLNVHVPWHRSAHLGVGGKYLVIAVIETAKPLIAPSLSKVTELLMKRIVEANAADTNTMKMNFIVHKDIHSNHELCVCVWGGGGETVMNES